MHATVGQNFICFWYRSIIFLQFRFWYIVFLPVHIMLQQQRKHAVLSKANLINQSLNGIRHLARNRYFIGTFFKNAMIFCYLKFCNTKPLSSGTFESLLFIIFKHQQLKVVNSSTVSVLLMIPDCFHFYIDF